MEGIETPAPIATPAPAPAPAPVASPAPAPATYEDGGALGSITGGKMNIKDIVISALIITSSIYFILFCRKAIKKLDEQPTYDEFDNMSGKIEEIEANVKRALGKRYQNN